MRIEMSSCLGLDLCLQEGATRWQQPAIPMFTLDKDERPDLPWWKIKIWPLHILARIFER